MVIRNTLSIIDNSLLALFISGRTVTVPFLLSHLSVSTTGVKDLGLLKVTLNTSGTIWIVLEELAIPIFSLWSDL